MAFKPAYSESMIKFIAHIIENNCRSNAGDIGNSKS